MKIAIVCPYDYHSPGGVQTHIHDCANALRNKGHIVKIIAPFASKQPNDNANLIFLGRSKKVCFNQTEFDVSIICGNEKKKLEKILKIEKFDIIHFHTIWTPFLPLQILLASNSANIATFHDTPPDSFSGKITKILFRFLSMILMRRLDAAIAVSGAPAEHLAKVPGKEMHILPPCIDLRPYSPEIKPLVPNKNKTITILFFGRLDERKGIFILLQAFQKLIEEKFDVRLIIAGKGKEYKKILQFIESSKLTQVITLGYIQESQKPACYASCDIFCSPAPHGESFGIVLVEAMASGKPIVAAANTGYREILKDMSSHCLAEPQNVDSFYLKLKNLIQDSVLRKTLGEWGLKEAKKYDCSTLIDRYLQIYQNTLLLKD